MIFATLLSALALADPVDPESYRAVHHSDLTRIEGSAPPTAPRGRSCVLRVFVDAEGKPVDVGPREEACPEDLVPSSVEIVSRWRWAPLARDGLPGPFQLYVKLEFPMEVTAPQVLRRVMPDYPRNLPSVPSGLVNCSARLFIDETGAPYDLTWERCPMDFRASAMDALRAERPTR